MNAQLMAETENMRRTAERLQRAGLVVDRNTFSRAHRRAFFALQCQLASEQTAASQTPIGFTYPNGSSGISRTSSESGT